MWWTKKRLQWIPPLGILALTVALGAGLVIRGSKADDVEDPRTEDDGILCQVYRSPTGKPVRCAVVLPIAADAAWRIVRDYDHFAELFDTGMWSIELTGVEPAGEARVHLMGRIRSVIGAWPYDLHITHEEHADRKVASWDEPSDVFPVNRGNRTVRALGPNRTLLCYTLEIQKANTPGFLVNNVLLDQIRIAVDRVRARAESPTTSP